MLTADTKVWSLVEVSGLGILLLVSRSFTGFQITSTNSTRLTLFKDYRFMLPEAPRSDGRSGYNIKGNRGIRRKS